MIHPVESGIMKKSKLKCLSAAAALVALFAAAVPVHAVSLVGVTGDQNDGAPPSINPEALFFISQADASATFIMNLGNVDDGETIGYNQNDGLLYHAPGISDGDRYWERINVNTQTIVTSGQFKGANVDEETLAMTYNPSTSQFLVTNLDDEFFDTALGGMATDIGDVEDKIQGLAFVGMTLFAGEAFDSLLHTLDPLNGSTLTTVNVTLGGNSISGFNGLATHPGTGELWGIVRSGIGPGNRQLAIINTTTGVASSVGTLSERIAGVGFVDDPGYAPILQPLTLLLLGSGLVGLAVWRSKAKNKA